MEHLISWLLQYFIRTVSFVNNNFFLSVWRLLIKIYILEPLYTRVSQNNKFNLISWFFHNLERTFKNAFINKISSNFMLFYIEPKSIYLQLYQYAIPSIT